MSSPARTYFAHSANHEGRWHPLRDHLAAVSRLAAEYCAGWEAASEAELAGLLHDAGKYGDAFQDRLHGQGKGLDHWSAGAFAALQRRCVAAALAIQGHHVGLQRMSKPSLRALTPQALAQDRARGLTLTEPNFDRLLERLTADGLDAQAPKMTALGNTLIRNVATMLDVRLLFSALVDADFVDTEAHFEGDAHGKRYRRPGPALDPTAALAAVLAHIERLAATSGAAGPVASVREALRLDCLAAADESPGLFNLTAPTGSGKTLAMLAFALAHAARHGLRRVVVAIPFLSIIEQTAEVYRRALGDGFPDDYVLEHHSLASSGAETWTDDAVSEPERRRRLLAENWDAPLVVTTSVQLLESLFANRPGRCRRLHRLRGAVIMLDEVQSLPAELAVPTLAALSHLAERHGSTVVMATATQPAFEHLAPQVRAQSPSGWSTREIAADPPAAFRSLKRVDVTWHDTEQPWSWDAVAQRMADTEQALCVVNLKRHAMALWEALEEIGNAFHLSTNLCPAHRQDLLAEVRARLRAGQPCRLVATQCIEAGVDVDFPRVYRAMGPLDAVIQAAGRCNREGRRVGGEVHVFTPEDRVSVPPGAYHRATAVTRMLLKEGGPAAVDIHDPAVVRAYFRRLYDLSRPDAGNRHQDLAQAVSEGDFPKIAQQYRLIEQDTVNVLVPYAARRDDFDALREMALSEGVDARWVRAARPLAVALYRPRQNDPVWDSLLEVPARSRRDREEWFVYAAEDHYHEALGLVPANNLNLWIA